MCFLISLPGKSLWVNNSLTSLSGNSECMKIKFFARWPFATNFFDVWLTVQNSSGLAGGPWAIISQSQPSSKRWREVNSDNWSTPPWLLRAPQGHCLPAWPACLSVAGDLSQSYLCLSLHPHHLLCWQCSLTPTFKDVCSVYLCMWARIIADVPQHFGYAAYFYEMIWQSPTAQKDYGLMFAV